MNNIRNIHSRPFVFTFGFDSGKYDSYHNRNGDRFYFGDSEGQTAWGTSYLEEVQNDSDKSEEIF